MTLRTPWAIERYPVSLEICPVAIACIYYTYTSESTSTSTSTSTSAVHVQVYIYLHIYNIYCIYIHTHTHGCLHVLFHVFLNPCKSIQKYWCWLYLFISKCMYVCIYMYVYVYIYICLSLHPHRTILCGSLSVCYIAVATPETILKLKMSQTHASGWLTVLDGFGSTIHQIL